MTRPDQHSIIDSIKRSLNDQQSLLDSRSEKDRLNFVASFSSLLNFYDQYNRQHGSWEPFVLKDPVILLASISKTDFASAHSLYQNICRRIDKIFPPKKDLGTNDGSASGLEQLYDPVLVAESMNQLFDLLTNVFLKIRRWVYFMQLSDEEYPLRSFILSQVKAEFSLYFWALISLRQNLCLLNIVKGIKPVNHDELNLFDAVDEMIWKQNKDKRPCWDVLGLAYPLTENKVDDFLKVITATGNKVFRFQHTIIQYASEEFDQLKLKKGKFPDTLLIRAFVELLKTQQQQLNTITEKHLRFCYKDILKLKELNAEPDAVYICAELAKKDSIFLLPANTLFDAGSDLQNNPVSFASDETVIISPATIVNAYTISTIKDIDGRMYLYKDIVRKPGILKQDDKGIVQTWNTFGGISISSVKQNQALSIASPLLLLREGKRYICVTVVFENQVDRSCLDNVNYYLSTKKAWHPVKCEIDPNITTPLISQATIVINLDEKDPPIEPFTKTADQKDPDGLSSEWPLFKIEFQSYVNIALPPIVTSMKIEVVVSDIKTLQLFNDNGALNSKAPFLPLGPTPMTGNSLIIGSDEVFSKPLNKMMLELDWDKLPPDFTNYYKEYNQYLTEQALLNTPPEKKNIFRKIFNWFGQLPKKIACFFYKKRCPAIIPECPPFCNTSFRVNFKILQGRSWTDTKIIKAGCFKNESGALGWMQYPAVDPGCNCKDKYTNDGSPGTITNDDLTVQLFSTDGVYGKTTPVNFQYKNPCTGDTLENASIPGYFVFNSADTGVSTFKPDEHIQQSPLLFSETSSSGFIKMSLAAPEYGFGSAIYAAVVAWITYKNGKTLIPPKADEDLFDFLNFSQKKAEPKFSEAAKIPFAPKLSGLKINYSTSQEYKFNNIQNTAPVQCFYYSPFENYCIYESPALVPANALMFDLTGIKPTAGITGIPLFQSVSNEGNLFLELDQVIPGSDICIYFELTHSFQINTVASSVSFQYLSINGWQILPVLNDSTNNFNCSGVIKFRVPADITNGSILMPGNKYWFAVTIDQISGNHSKTAFLKANGFIAKRVMDAPYYDKSPYLKAGSISKPRKSIPQIGSLVQPFASFGGQGRETEQNLWLRASSRLSTKDRAVTNVDIYRLTTENFRNVYHCRSLYDTVKDMTMVYVIRVVSSKKDAHAFTPLVNNCILNAIQQFLCQRASGANNITVSNFRFQYVRVIAGIELKNGFEFTSVCEQVNDAINLYMSPWITDSKSTLNLEQAISDIKLISMISSIQGIKKVKTLRFKTWIPLTGQEISPDDLPDTPVAKQNSGDCLLIPVAGHDIKEI